MSLKKKPVKTNFYQLLPIYTTGWSFLILAGRNINPAEAKVEPPNPKKGEWNLASRLSLKSYEPPLYHDLYLKIDLGDN